MLHRIERVYEAELRNIVAFQRRVLEFACLPTLTAPLARAEADVHFGAQTDWFWSNTSLHPLVRTVNRIVRGNAALSQRVIAAFDDDVAFDTRIDDAIFRFSCRTLPNGVRDTDLFK